MPKYLKPGLANIISFQLSLRNIRSLIFLSNQYLKVSKQQLHNWYFLVRKCVNTPEKNVWLAYFLWKDLNH